MISVSPESKECINKASYSSISSVKAIVKWKIKDILQQEHQPEWERW